MSNKRINYFLIVVLVLAALMRFYNYSSWSLSNDELSALVRLHSHNFSSLISEGVRPDFHPAGVQVFLFYWCGLLGDSPDIVRLPFVILGVLSVLVIYLIGKIWFSKSVGIFAALALAFLQFPILYSQLARPYSPGLFFVLLNVYAWSQLLFFADEKLKWRYALFYGLTCVGCMYTHYFSFLFAILVGLTGLFFLNKNNILKYIAGATIATLLFLPHLNITLEQMSRGGVGSWLGKPESDYLSKFLFYSFNQSWLLIAVFIFIFLISYLFNQYSVHNNRFRIIALVWFFGLFFIGYYYSLYFNPVLQYSILLFAFPFLILFIFSYINKNQTALNFMCFVLLFMVGVSSTAFGFKYYNTQQFGVFKELAQKNMEWENKFGKKNTAKVYNLIAHQYIDYYFDHNGYKTPYTFLRGDDTLSKYNLRRAVQQAWREEKEYFIFGWSNIYTPNEFYEIIRISYPQIVEHCNYFNSAITLFKRDASLTHFDIDIQQYFENKSNTHFFCDTSLIKCATSSDCYFALDSLNEYACEYKATVSQLFPAGNLFFNVSLDYKSLSKLNPQFHLVCEIHRGDSLLSWSSAISSHFPMDENNCGSVFFTQNLPLNSLPDDEVKIYIWNRTKQNIYIDNIRIFGSNESNQFKR